MKKLFVLMAVAVVAFLVGMHAVSAASAEEPAAVKAAKAAALKEGMVVGEAEVIYDPINKKWEERVLAIERLPANPNHGVLPHGVLLNKKYETVFLDFKEGAKDADTWIFVDKATGSVLTIYQEKR